ncbi:MAG: hypothetical protein U9N40_04105, partial [Euryarchaeota archaeon]|nr:hypothetical protein [Euryarchaeota archaeon]
MVPGITVGIGSQSIDYNAVAYRTGVILVEDPGYCVIDDDIRDRTYWEQKKNTDLKKADIQRFGLAVSSVSCNILSLSKTERFFNEPGPGYYNFTPTEYRDRLFFTDIPYHYNISLKSVGAGIDYYSVGGPVPECEYGYIRRLVKVKEYIPTATIDLTYSEGNWDEDPGSGLKTYTVAMDFSTLLNKSINPAYRIDPSSESVTINMTNFGETLNGTFTYARLDKIELNRSNILFNLGDPAAIDGNNAPILPYNVASNISLIVEPEDYHGKITSIDQIEIIYTFDNSPSRTNISGTFNYNYLTVSAPQLKDGVVEVA